MTTTQEHLTERDAWLAGTLATFTSFDEALDFAQWGDEDDRAAESAAECAAENAWLRAAEYDPEADGFDRYEASLGVIPFDVALAEATR